MVHILQVIISLVFALLFVGFVVFKVVFNSNKTEDLNRKSLCNNTECSNVESENKGEFKTTLENQAYKIYKLKRYKFEKDSQMRDYLNILWANINEIVVLKNQGYQIDTQDLENHYLPGLFSILDNYCAYSLFSENVDPVKLKCSQAIVMITNKVCQIGKQYVSAETTDVKVTLIALKSKMEMDGNPKNVNLIKKGDNNDGY